MQQKLFFGNSKGGRLCGVLSDPNPKKEKPIIILCHGFTRSKYGSTVLNLEKVLNEKGIATFRFDFYGHGESDGKFKDVTVSEAVDDVLNAIKFLKRKGWKKIGLEGGSFGGIASLMAASRSRDLYLLALISPVSNWLEKILEKKTKEYLQNWKKRGYNWYENKEGKRLRLNYSFFKDLKNNNGFKAAKKIKIPTIIVHGSRDESVPLKQSIKTASLIKNCRLEIIKGANHRYTNPKDNKKRIELISSFIIENS